MQSKGMLVFKLDALLKQHNISPQEFAKYVEKKGLMSGVAIHKFVSGDRFPRETSLNAILEALRSYTGKDIDVSDLLEYIPDKPVKTKK
jgi:predicted transcriptional regulator